MYTYCPDCSSVYEISAEQLGAASGLVRCGNCNATFSALRRLTETPPEFKADTNATAGAKADQTKRVVTAAGATSLVTGKTRGNAEASTNHADERTSIEESNDPAGHIETGDLPVPVEPLEDWDTEEGEQDLEMLLADEALLDQEAPIAVHGNDVGMAADGNREAQDSRDTDSETWPGDSAAAMAGDPDIYETDDTPEDGGAEEFDPDADVASEIADEIDLDASEDPDRADTADSTLDAEESGDADDTNATHEADDTAVSGAADDSAAALDAEDAAASGEADDADAAHEADAAEESDVADDSAATLDADDTEVSGETDDADATHEADDTAASGAADHSAATPDADDAEASGETDDADATHEADAAEESGDADDTEAAHEADDTAASGTADDSDATLDADDTGASGAADDTDATHEADAAEESGDADDTDATHEADDTGASGTADDTDATLDADDTGASGAADDTDATHEADDTAASGTADDSAATLDADDTGASGAADDTDATHEADAAEESDVADDTEATHEADDAEESDVADDTEATHEADDAEASSEADDTGASDGMVDVSDKPDNTDTPFDTIEDGEATELSDSEAVPDLDGNADAANILIAGVDGTFDSQLDEKRDYQDLSQYLTPRKSFARRIGEASILLLLLTILGAQFVHHNRTILATHPQYGSYLQSTYKSLGLGLDIAQSADDYRVARHTIVPDANNLNTLMARATIVNNSVQPRPVPMVRLELRNRWGDAIFARVFSAEEYLAGTVPATMAGNSRLEVALDIVNPTDDIDIGYSFEICVSGHDGTPNCDKSDVFE